MTHLFLYLNNFKVCQYNSNEIKYNYRFIHLSEKLVLYNFSEKPGK